MVLPAKPKLKADKAASQVKPKLKVNEASHIQSCQFPDPGGDVVVTPPDVVNDAIAPPPDFADDSDTPLSVFMDDVIIALPADFIVPPPDEFADDVVVPPNQSAMILKASEPCRGKPTDDAGMLIP